MENVDICKSFLEQLNQCSDKEKREVLKIINVRAYTGEIPEREMECCPHCKEDDFVKNGKRNGKQRYLCRNPACGRTFGETTNTLLHGIHHNKETWITFIQSELNTQTIEKTAKACGIARSTAFIWRHKFADVIRRLNGQAILEGDVQMDETYFDLSFKGFQLSEDFYRPPKKRGGSLKQGLSDEVVCVPCASDGEHIIASVEKLGSADTKAIIDCLNHRIKAGNTLITDSSKVYPEAAKQLNLKHIAIPSGQHSCQGKNIQRINSFHAYVRSIIDFNYHSVSTKYLNNYLALLDYGRYINRKMVKFTQVCADILNSLLTVPYRQTAYEVTNRPAAPRSPNNALKKQTHANSTPETAQTPKAEEKPKKQKPAKNKTISPLQMSFPF